MRRRSNGRRAARTDGDAASGQDGSTPALAARLGNRRTGRLLARSADGDPTVAVALRRGIARSAPGSVESPAAEGSEQADAEARQQFARAERSFAAGRYRQAIILMEDLRHHPSITGENEGRLLYNIGLSNLRLERYATAILYFERYLESEGADESAGQRHLELAQRRAGATRPAEPGQDEPTAAVDSIEEARRLLDRSFELYDRGRYARAIILMERVRQAELLGPDNLAPLLYNMGMANLKLERYATATLYFERYLDSDLSESDREDGEERLAEARAGVSGDVDAISSPGSVESPAAEGSEQADAEARQQFARAERSFAAGRYRQAIILMEDLRHHPSITGENEGRLLYNIGLSNLRLERYATAILYFERYLESEGADESAGQRHLELAQRRAGATRPAEPGQDEPTAAVDSIEEARRLLDRSFELYDRGRYARAIILMERVRQAELLGPDNLAPLLYNMGMANLKLERYATATLYFERYLDSDLSESDREDGEERLAEARAGVSGDVDAISSRM